MAFCQTRFYQYLNTGFYLEYLKSWSFLMFNKEW